MSAETGSWRRVEDGWELRFERRLHHSPQRVWTALTTGEGLACWLAEGLVELRAGGRMDLHFRQPATPDFPDTPQMRRQANTVLHVEPLRRFDHSFGHPDSVVSWRLEPDGDGTHLTLIHRVPQAWECDLSRTLAGWRHHLEGLEDAADGVAHPWSWPRWTALRDAYADLIAENPMSQPVEIRVEKPMRHPAARVFDAFLDPVTVGQWLFHTPDGVMEKTEYDPRPGGDFAIFERRGADLARHFGRFVEIERPSRIVFDFWVDEAPEAPTRVTVTFTPVSDGCVVVLTHDLAPAWADYADRTVHGWTMILDTLAGVIDRA